MGAVYSLAGHPRRELFELGKWWAPVLLDEETYRSGPWPLEDFTRLVTGYERPVSREYEPWLLDVIPRLHAFCERNAWDVDIVVDTGDELWDLLGGGYAETGSVYDDFKPEPYVDYRIEMLRKSKLVVSPEELEALEALARADRMLTCERTVERLRRERTR